MWNCSYGISDLSKMVSDIVSTITGLLAYDNINKSCPGLNGVIEWGECWKENDLDDFLFMVLGAFEHEIDITDIYFPHFICSEPKYDFSASPTISIKIEIPNKFCIYAKNIGYYDSKGEAKVCDE